MNRFRHPKRIELITKLSRATSSSKFLSGDKGAEKEVKDLRAAIKQFDTDFLSPRERVDRRAGMAEEEAQA